MDRFIDLGDVFMKIIYEFKIQYGQIYSLSIKQFSHTKKVFKIQYGQIYSSAVAVPEIFRKLFKIQYGQIYSVKQTF